MVEGGFEFVLEFSGKIYVRGGGFGGVIVKCVILLFVNCDDGVVGVVVECGGGVVVFVCDVDLGE